MFHGLHNFDQNAIASYVIYWKKIGKNVKTNLKNEQKLKKYN